MRYIEVTFENGYAGCDINEYYVFSDDITDEEIDTNEHICLDFDNYVEDYKPTYLDEDEEGWYYENATWSWCEITKEEYEEWSK